MSTVPARTEMLGFFTMLVEVCERMETGFELTLQHHLFCANFIISSFHHLTRFHHFMFFHHFIISSFTRFRNFIISSSSFIMSSFHHLQGSEISSFHHLIIYKVPKFHHFIIFVHYFIISSNIEWVYVHPEGEGGRNTPNCKPGDGCSCNRLASLA